jgi:hypothetical protein
MSLFLSIFIEMMKKTSRSLHEGCMYRQCRPSRSMLLFHDTNMLNSCKLATHNLYYSRIARFEPSGGEEWTMASNFSVDGGEINYHISHLMVHTTFNRK